MEQDLIKIIHVPFEEYEKLYQAKINLSYAAGAVKSIRDDDGGLRIPKKCVDLLLQIMEEGL